MRTGNLKPYESRDEVSKIFIRRPNSAFTKSSAKHRLVWISSMEVLESYLQHALQVSLSSFSVEHCGVWALIVGEGRDMLFVHHYVQIYESLYVAERRSRVAEGGDGANASRSMELFRSWLGLESSQIHCEDLPRCLKAWLFALAALTTRSTHCYGCCSEIAPSNIPSSAEGKHSRHLGDRSARLSCCCCCCLGTMRRCCSSKLLAPLSFFHFHYRWLLHVHTHIYVYIYTYIVCVASKLSCL